VSDAHPRWQYAEGQDEYPQEPQPQDPYAQQYGDYAYGGHAQSPYPDQQQPQQPRQHSQDGRPAEGHYDPRQQGQQQQEQQQQGQQQQEQQQQGQQQQEQQQQEQQQYGQQYQQQGYTDPYYYPGQEQYQGYIPQQPQYQEYDGYQQQFYQQPAAAPAAPAAPTTAPAPDPEPVPAPAPRAARTDGPAPDYKTEQFAFVDEDDEESEEVIDWLKFTESRTERRDERKRRGRNRVTALIVVLVLALAGGVGYLWQAGKLPGLGSSDATATASGAQKRDVIVLHLRPVDSNESSTALLVGNSTTHKGYTVLLPNSLAVSTDDGGSTTLGKSVDGGAGPTRDALSTLLGTNINGTWRLDTPYLQLLVEALGDITVDTDATVKTGKGSSAKTVVQQGKAQDLNGQAAVAYATYRGPGETEDKQLARFGQVMQAVLKKMPSDTGLATKTVQSLNAIPDPSLSEKALGASLAALAEDAKTGAFSTVTLPVQTDGTLSEKSTNSVVKDILGGTVKNTDAGGTPSVSVKNATGDTKKANSAQVAMVNAGYTFVSGGTAATPQATSSVTYGDAKQKQNAIEVAKTLGLPTKLVTKGTGAANADITVVLGKDYTPGQG
jgi:anionic cell wall polymer biosynthesis LytR-Cps2A-Psr (LCP) family protein